MVYWNHLPDHPNVIPHPFTGLPLCNTVIIWLEPPLCNTVIIWRDPPPIHDYVICARPLTGLLLEAKSEDDQDGRAGFPHPVFQQVYCT